MSGPELVAGAFRDLLCSFSARLDEAAGLPIPLASDVPLDPYRQYAADDLVPLIEALQALPLAVPVEWLFGEYVTEHAHEALSARLLNAANLGEALEVFRVYSPLVASFMDVSHRSERDGSLTVMHSLDPEAGPVHRFIFRTFVTTSICYICHYRGEPVDFSRRIHGREDFDAFVTAVNNEIYFMNLTASEFEMNATYPPETLAYGIAHWQQRLCTALDIELMRRAEVMPVRRSWASRVRQVVQAGNNLGVDIEEVATELRLDRRTLARHLRAEGTNFTTIVGGMRRERAMHLICNTQTPLKRIAAETGFTSDASFSMAFKSWTGVSPLAYRRSYSA